MRRLSKSVADLKLRYDVVVLADGSVSQGFSDNGFKKLFGVGK